MISRGAGPLDDDRDHLAAVQMPALQALETIDDLEPAMAQRNHPDRQVAQILGPPHDHARAETLIRGLQVLEGNEQDLGSGGFFGHPGGCGGGQRWGMQAIHEQKVAGSRFRSRLYSLYNHGPPCATGAWTGCRSTRRLSMFTITPALAGTSQNLPESPLGSRRRLSILTIIPVSSGPIRGPGATPPAPFRREFLVLCCNRFRSAYRGTRRR